jgi:hypothetical protein
MRVEESVDIGRPVEEVFAFATDPKTWSEWADPVIEVRQPTSGQLRQQGGKFATVNKFLGRGSRRPTRRPPTSPTGGSPTGARAGQCRTRRPSISRRCRAEERAVGRQRSLRRAGSSGWSGRCSKG